MAKRKTFSTAWTKGHIKRSPLLAETREVMRARLSALFLAFGAVLLTGSGATAWEIDNVTCATRPLQDSTAAVNAETNRRMADALATVNQANEAQLKRYKAALERREFLRESGWNNEIDNLNDEMAEAGQAGPGSLDRLFQGMNPDELKASDLQGCSKTLLEEAMSGALAGAWMGNLETWAKSAPLSKCEVPVADSVFSIFSVSESPVARSFGLSPVIMVNGVRIGVDKLSHFMTEGRDYWRHTRPHYDVNEAMKIGIDEEEGRYGWRATGVKSYGDMAANYQGFQFWKNLYEGDRPYFKCEGGRWKQARSFDWKDYVNASMDESINCNEYKTASMNERALVETTRRYAGTEFEGMSCPRSLRACSELVQRIKPADVLETIIHPRCLAAGRGRPMPSIEGSGRPGGGAEPDVQPDAAIERRLTPKRSPPTGGGSQEGAR